MNYGSICSGIEAGSAAWHPLGWRATFLSEIEAFPRAVLAHHYPAVPLHGDFTTIQAGVYEPIDLLVGGTPCQSFSVAGLRGGLDDERGNLALEYIRLAQRLRPRWLVWENVPSVLSSGAGRDFGAFLGGLVECGYGFAYRVLDAQYFGLAQRRKRVFVVGYLGDWRRAAAVLFEPESLRGHPPPRREARKDRASTIAARTRGGGGLGTDFDCDGGLIANTVAPTLESGGNRTGGTRPPGTTVDSADSLIVPHVAATLRARDGARGVDSDCTDTLIVHSLRAEGFDAGEDGTGRGTPLVAVDLQNMRIGGDTFGTLDTTRPTRGGGQCVLAFHENQRAELTTNDTAGSLKMGGGKPGQGYQAVAFGWQNSSSQGASVSEHHAPTLDKSKTPAVTTATAVRRLTPRECERLQGFPDDYTLIPYRGRPAADGPRYKALGNSMAVPVMRWIGRRIATVEATRDAPLFAEVAD